MDSTSPLYILTFAGLAQLTGWLALFTLRHPRRAGAGALRSLLLAMTVRSLAAVGAYLAPFPTLQLLSVKIEYLGFAALGPLWLAFALLVSGRSHLLTWRAQGLLAAPALLAAALALTNEAHNLIWTGAGPAPALPAGWGALGAIYAALTSGLLLAGAFVIVAAFARAPHAYRRPLGLLAAGSFLPLAGNALALAGLLPGPQFDLTRISLPLAGALFALGFLRFEQLNLAPVAARVVMDNLREPAVVLDAAGRVADLNGAARRAFGVDSEALGRPAAEALSPAEVWRQAAAAPEGRMEIQLPEAGGERHYALTLSPLRDERGRLLGRVALLHDVGHERAVLKMRDDLTHMLIHDLRNPFSAIYSALQLIDTLLREESGRAERNGPEAPLPRAAAVQGAIDIALHSAGRAQEMLDSLLDLNRLESGQMPVTPEALDAGQIAREVAGEMAPAAAGRDLQLQFEIPNGLPLGRADPDLLDRVLRNLLGNALKFTPPGGRVTLAARAEGECLALSVSDTGPGIPPQIEPRLFQKFVRGPGPAHGTGLGLAFCKQAVEAMGGRLWVESEPGRGAAFHFTLPLAARVEQVQP